MRGAAPDPADEGLHPSLRGPDGYVRLVQGIGLRVSIVGTRGKATLARLLADALKRRGLPTHCNAPREPLDPARLGTVAKTAAALGLSPEDRALVEQERRALKLAWPVQALVVANRARSPSGMRHVHSDVALPHYVLVTNVRRDPAGLTPRPLQLVARDVARAITPGAVVLSGESDPILKGILRRECERGGLTFLDAAPSRPGVPAAELVSLLQAFLLHRFGRAFDAEEEQAVRRDLEGRFRWAPSAIPGVRWFHAGPIHDVDSAQIVLNHLQAQRRSPVTFIAYFRADRPGRTRAFVPFLEELLGAPDTRQVILAGHRAHAIAERLATWASQVQVVDDDVAAVPRLVRRLQFDCQGGAIVTLCNGNAAWPQELARHLQRPSAPAPPGAVAVAAGKAASAAGGPAAPAAVPAPAPPAQPQAQAVASSAPKRIIRPMVAPVAPASARAAALAAEGEGGAAPPAPEPVPAASPLARAAVAAATPAALGAPPKPDAVR